MCLLHRLPSGCTSRKAFRKEGGGNTKLWLARRSHNIRQYMSYKIDACALMNALLETWPD
jgi:hypothetical protein